MKSEDDGLAKLTIELEVIKSATERRYKAVKKVFSAEFFIIRLLPQDAGQETGMTDLDCRISLLTAIIRNQTKLVLSFY
ncbi:hypothetical protein [Nitrosomonas cryotolerans]|nr:hypothetical protein [Nitrosomonas cryotolerans]